MRLRNFLPSLILCLASAAAHADTFSFSATGSGGGFSGSGTLSAVSNGNGSYTINGITGTGVTGLIPVNGFQGNDNLLFPTAANLLDIKGFAFTDLQGNTAFKVRIYEDGGSYFASLLDSDGVPATLPVDFSIGTTPEPSSLLLLATGALGAGAMVRRRILA